MGYKFNPFTGNLDEVSAGGGGGTPGGSDTQVQFNDGGSTFGGDVDFTYNKTTNALSVGRIYTLSDGLMLGSSTVGPTLTASSNSANASVKLSSNSDGTVAGGPVILEGSSSVFGGDLLHVVRKGDASTSFKVTNGGNGHFLGNLTTTSLTLANGALQTFTTSLTLGNNHHITWTGSANSNIDKDVGLQRVSAAVLKITNASTGGGIFELPQVASGGTPSSNSARIYSKDVSGTAEIFVMDEAGNETQISPHNTNAPEALIDSAFDEVGYTANYYTGIITYTNKRRQISGRPDAQFIETFEEHNARTGASLAAWDWDKVQVEQAALRETERAEWVKRKEDWEANPENADKPFTEQEPEAFVIKPKPKWLADQLAAKDDFLASRFIGSNLEWLKFGTALSQDAVINNFFSTLSERAPILDRMLTVGLGQAAQGHMQTFLEAWKLGVSAGAIPTDMQQHLVAIANGYELPRSFVDGLEYYLDQQG